MLKHRGKGRPAVLNRDLTGTRVAQLLRDIHGCSHASSHGNPCPSVITGTNTSRRLRVIVTGGISWSRRLGRAGRAGPRNNDHASPASSMTALKSSSCRTKMAALGLPACTKAGSVHARLARGPPRWQVSGSGLTKPRSWRGFAFVGAEECYDENMDRQRRATWHSITASNIITWP